MNLETTHPLGTGERLKALEEALEPFAKVARAYDYWCAEVMPTFTYPVDGTRLELALLDCPDAIGGLTESDFRRARALLPDPPQAIEQVRAA